MSVPTARRLPAFGRELVELRRRGHRPSDPVMVYLDRWPSGHAPFAVPTLAVPRGTSAACLDWSCMHGLEAHLLTWTGEGIAAAVDALLRAGARTVLVQNFAAPHDDRGWWQRIDTAGPADVELSSDWRQAA